jgi:hypothetical protein
MRAGIWELKSGWLVASMTEITASLQEMKITLFSRFWAGRRAPSPRVPLPHLPRCMKYIAIRSNRVLEGNAGS